MTDVFVLYGQDHAPVEVCSAVPTSGTCPRVPVGQPVRCAGLQLVVRQARFPDLVLDVEPNATACPVAALGLGPRQTITARANRYRREVYHGHD